MLLAMLLVLVCACAFLQLGQSVVAGDTKAIDEAILMAMRNQIDPSQPLGPRWLQEIGRDVTALGGLTVLTGVSLLAIGLLWLSGRRHAAWLVLVAVGGATVLSFWLKDSYDRPRPDLVPHGSIVYTRSFPSGHSMLAAVTYMTIAAVLMRLTTDRGIRYFVLFAAVFVTIVVGVSRVYLGVHWPSDVVAGWTLGTGWACLAWVVARALQRRCAVEPASDSMTVG